GYAVDATDNGADALYLGTEFPIDIAIIDLGLPDISGMDVIKQLRSREINFPILILTARTRWEEKVEGLEAGADDYLVKPFHTEELLARMNAMIRRSVGVSTPQLLCGSIKLDTTAQQVFVDDVAIELTAYEYKMLEYMMLHSGKVISKTEITEHIYDQDFDRDSNVIEVFIGRLRKKLDPNDQLKPIETLRGRGYRFSIPLNHS
ncbi:MAG: response regulator transcription factor, partial [Cycloclasticus sp.]|nr:response regulator transcription factor [Cycloclasticus sp.]